MSTFQVFKKDSFQLHPTAMCTATRYSCILEKILEDEWERTE